MTKSVKQPAALKKKVFSPKQLKLSRFHKGHLAEDLACSFLTSKNYLILERNLDYQNREVDLIALDQAHDEIVFCEVKYRRNEDHGAGYEAVNNLKLAKMTRVASAYLKKMQLQKDYRFDIISVCGDLDRPSIEHFENITWL